MALESLARRSAIDNDTIVRNKDFASAVTYGIHFILKCNIYIYIYISKWYWVTPSTAIQIFSNAIYIEEYLVYEAEAVARGQSGIRIAMIVID